MTSHYHLAQLNIAKLAAPLDSPPLADFVAALDRINALAEASPGFVWRLKDDAGNATAFRPFGDDVIVNMSVWTGRQALFDYVYASDHTPFLKRRKEWFAMPAGDDPHLVMWWVPVGTYPDLIEAEARLTLLKRFGPNQNAFTFKRFFEPLAD